MLWRATMNWRLARKKDHLFFIIGDVSDKGIPAALFMAITKAIFKSHFLSSTFENLTDEVRQVNHFLNTNNNSFMFVTAFMGIIDLKTGAVEYIDAGHEPMPIRRKDGTVETGEETPKEINDSLLDKLQDFIGEADPFDDIAVLTIHYKS